MHIRATQHSRFYVEFEMQEPIEEIVKRWVEGEFIPSCARVIPGKI
jgi:hypothetical protein